MFFFSDRLTMIEDQHPIHVLYLHPSPFEIGCLISRGIEIIKTIIRLKSSDYFFNIFSTGFSNETLNVLTLLPLSTKEISEFLYFEQGSPFMMCFFSQLFLTTIN